MSSAYRRDRAREREICLDFPHINLQRTMSAGKHAQ